MKNKGITLIGMPGSGKSTLGRLLAKELELDFIDLDEVITQTTTVSPNEYIEKNKEDKFIDLEEKNTLMLDLRNKVFSPGGSIIYSKRAMNKLKRETVIVYIKVPREKLKARIKTMNFRAIIGLKEHGFDKLFNLRTPMYEKNAHITIEVTNESENITSRKIAQALQEKF